MLPAKSISQNSLISLSSTPQPPGSGLQRISRQRAPTQDDQRSHDVEQQLDQLRVEEDLH
jgi:hypothetical protein